ncbi:MAG: Gfo/Idh/MocA family protein [Planctomycetota bacterium]|jgi:predicted dehydrogenase
MGLRTQRDPGAARAGGSARRPLTAAIIGLGVGEQHIAGYQGHPACSVGVICDIDAATLGAVAERHPGLATTTDPETVLTDPAIDVVSIASYDDAHAEQILTALRHGKHVFVEKPVCLRADEADAIGAALDERPHLRFGSNLILRASPRFRRLREMIATGALGDLFHIEAAYNYGRLQKITDGWRGRLPYYSVMLGGGVHMADLLLWLTGRRVVEVSAFGNAIASRGTDFRFNDLVTGIVRFDDGMTAALTANFGCVLPHGHALSVYGTAGTFVNDHPDARLERSALEGGTVQVQDPGQQP